LQIHFSVYSERTQYVLAQESVGILDLELPCTKHILAQYRGLCSQCYTGKETTKGRSEAYLKHKAGEGRRERRHLEGREHIGTTLRKTNQNLGNSETQRLGDSAARQLGSLATRDIGNSVTRRLGASATYRPTSHTKTQGRTPEPNAPISEYPDGKCVLFLKVDQCSLLHSGRVLAFVLNSHGEGEYITFSHHLFEAAPVRVVFLWHPSLVEHDTDIELGVWARPGRMSSGSGTGSDDLMGKVLSFLVEGGEVDMEEEDIGEATSSRMEDTQKLPGL
jgi:hypothetical protein